MLPAFGRIAQQRFIVDYLFEINQWSTDHQRWRVLGWEQLEVISLDADVERESKTERKCNRGERNVYLHS